MADLYVAPPSEYNPVQGEVVLVEYLPSGRPVLVVELRNKHRIRSILNNDDIHSDSLPSVGTHVECVQHEGLWSYVRTVDVLQGRATVGVDGAGLVITGERSALYSTPNQFLGMSDSEILLQSANNQIRMRSLDVEVSALASGVNFGDGMRLTGGRVHTPSTLVYHPVVARAGVNPGGGLRLAQHIAVDDALVDDMTTDIPADAAPVATLILETYAANRRNYRWQAYTDALWYNVRWLFQLASTPAAIAAVLAENYTLSEGILATHVDDTNLTIPVSLRAPFFDEDRGVGRTQYLSLAGVGDLANRTNRQIEVIGFQVQAQLGPPNSSPLRPTIWSDPYYIFYVDWEMD